MATPVSRFMHPQARLTIHEKRLIVHEAGPMTTIEIARRRFATRRYPSFIRRGQGIRFEI